MNASSSSRAPDWRQGWLWLAIVAVVAAVFQGAAQGSFLRWDDDINIVSNDHLRSLGRDNLRWMFTDSDYIRRYVPFTWLGWALDHAWFGLTPKSAHVGNIALHAANAVLVFLVLARVLEQWTGLTKAYQRRLQFAAAIGALIWAVHPLRVEVVAWASGRIYCQAAFFLLVSTLCYLRAAAGEMPRRRGLWLAFSIASFLASLLTYPLALGFVGLLLVLDTWVLRRFSRTSHGWNTAENRGVLLEKIPFVLATVAIVALTLWARAHARGIWEPLPTLAEFSLGARIMQACYIFGYYVWRPLVPVGLSPVYSTLGDVHPMDPIFALSAAGVIAVSVLAIWQRRRWPAFLALWISHLILIAPMTGLTEHPHFSNDRYSYLQGVVWAGAIATGGLWHGSAAIARGLRVALVGAIAAFGVLSAADLRIWRSSETLLRYLHDFLPSPLSRAEMSFRLGEYFRALTRFDDAAQAYLTALEERPRGGRAAAAHLGLGRIADYQGHTREAFDHYRQAMEMDVNSAETYTAFGEFLLRTQQPKDAVELLRRAAALRPRIAAVHQLLGSALTQAGAPREALAELDAAIRLQPGFVEAHVSMANALLALGRPAEAVVHAREALHANPDCAEAYASLGIAQRMLGRSADAITTLGEAVRLNPKLLQAQFTLAQALREIGRTSEATEAWRRVLQLDPTNAAAREALARLPAP